MAISASINQLQKVAITSIIRHITKYHHVIRLYDHFFPLCVCFSPNYLFLLQQAFQQVYRRQSVQVCQVSPQFPKLPASRKQRSHCTLTQSFYALKNVSFTVYVLVLRKRQVHLPVIKLLGGMHMCQLM